MDATAISVKPNIRMSISVNPLLELIIWSIQTSRKITVETIWDLLVHAPQYYEYWCEGIDHNYLCF